MSADSTTRPDPDPIGTRLRAALREGPGTSTVDLFDLRTATRSRIRRSRARRATVAAGLVLLVVTAVHGGLNSRPSVFGQPAGREPSVSRTSAPADRLAEIAPVGSGLEEIRVGDVTDDPGTRLSLIDTVPDGSPVPTVPGQTCQRLDSLSPALPQPVTGASWTFLFYGGLTGRKYDVTHNVTRWVPGVAAASFGLETQGSAGRCRWSGPVHPVGPPDGWQVLGRALPTDHDIWVATTGARDDQGHRVTVTLVAVRAGGYIVSTAMRPRTSSQPEDGQLELTTRLAVSAAVRLAGRELVR